MGIVKSFNNHPIAHATIIAIETGIGTLSDSIGKFEIKSIELPVWIKVSCIGYAPKTLYVDSTSKNNIEVVMESIPINLPTVVINDTRRKDAICCSPDEIFWDFHISQNSLWLLSKTRSNVLLRVLNLELEEIIKIKLPMRYFTFGNDVYKRLYLLSVDSAYSLNLKEKESIVILNKFTRKKYHEFKNTFEDACGHILYSKVDDIENRYFSFFVSDTLVNTIREFYSYYNKKSRLYSEDFKRELLQRNSYLSSNEIKEMGDIWFPENQAIKEYKQLNWFYNKVILKPAFCPLKSLNDTTYIFNYENDSIMVFDKKGSIIKGLKMTHQVKGAQNNEVLVDEPQKIFYFKYLKGGLVHLKRINLANGSVDFIKRIEKHSFPEKTLVHNNYIYYSCNDIQSGIKMLFREIIH